MHFRLPTPGTNSRSQMLLQNSCSHQFCNIHRKTPVAEQNTPGGCFQPGMIRVIAPSHFPFKQSFLQFLRLRVVFSNHPPVAYFKIPLLERVQKNPKQTEIIDTRVATTIFLKYFLYKETECLIQSLAKLSVTKYFQKTVIPKFMSNSFQTQM